MPRCMPETTAYDKYKMQTLNDKAIYRLVRDAGLVRSQYEFSELCGRNPTWFSCICSRQLGMSITALGLLIANIATRAAAAQDEHRIARLMDLHSALDVEMRARCRRRAEAFAMS